MSSSGGGIRRERTTLHPLYRSLKKEGEWMPSGKEETIHWISNPFFFFEKSCVKNPRNDYGRI